MKTKVLVVDDDPSIRCMLKDVLECGGYEVLVADDGMAAKIVLEHHSDIAVVITDTEMPRVDGFRLVGLIKQFHPNVPVIITTGSTDDDLLRRVAACEADRWFTKPYDIVELLGAVAELVQLTPAEV